ncbi:hypothetical protein SOASR014_11000 [Pectobacterium carotovorum subsp. carotovorum]|nr:hypothetical protein SOASR014_11000 [Pectobacterium carotovorum subsp. carotovorum]GLX43208.1 hypothetical protein Pcaca01_08760 [Pectobacterium carotovorum subsp. carotovorum]
MAIQRPDIPFFRESRFVKILIFNYDAQISTDFKQAIAYEAGENRLVNSPINSSFYRHPLYEANDYAYQ